MMMIDTFSSFFGSNLKAMKMMKWTRMKVMSLVIFSVTIDSVSTFPTIPAIGSQRQGSKLSKNLTRQLDFNEDYLVCHMMEAHVMYDESKEFEQSSENREIIRSCLTSSSQEPDGEAGMVYLLSDAFVESFSFDAIQNGTQTIIIEGAQAQRSSGMEDDVVVIPVQSDVYVVSTPTERRLGVSHFGTKTVLVLRVTSFDSTSSQSASTISSRLFTGVGTTISSVFRDCSWNSLNVLPASGTGIVDGVAEIFINQNTVGATAQSFENTVTAAARNQVSNFDGIDHVMYCMPAGTAGTWVAYGYLAWYRTVYNDEWCGYVSAAVHEIGHNIGLHHSSKGSVEYGDKQGMMGYSFRQINAPAMYVPCQFKKFRQSDYSHQLVRCFNGHKHWVLGWYRNRTVSINLSDGAWLGTVLAFTDYDQAENGDFVVVKVNNLYIQYNKAEEFNFQTMDKKNQLTIVEAENENMSSHVLGGIDQINSTFRYINFDSDSDLVVEVCSVADVGGKSSLLVSIYLVTQLSRCGASQAPLVPSTLPTDVPTQNPSLQPTVQPKKWPIVAPLTQTTTQPFLPPSGRPTRRPTRRPIRRYVSHPTVKPMTGKPVLKPEEHPLNGVCDDNRNTTFYVAGFGINAFKDCAWIAVNAVYQSRLCSEGNPSHARWNCPGTCGLCSDLCRDSNIRFPDTTGISRSCAWLSLRYDEKDLLCTPGSEAYLACSKTCNSCDKETQSNVSIVVSTVARTPSPTNDSLITSSVYFCDDSRDGTFYVEDTNKNEPCIWLASRPQYQLILCNERHTSGARDMCPETCGKCTDNCTDNNTDWFIADDGKRRSCKWLSLRNKKKDILCRQGFKAYELCSETCGTCDSP